MVALLLGVLMMTNRSMRQRSIMRKVSERVESTERFVDTSVLLHVVTSDMSRVGLLGTRDVNGRKLAVLDSKPLGGLIDTKLARPRIEEYSGDLKAKVWFCSEDQRAALFHAGTPLAQLIYGSEGAGKTTLLAMWHYLQWLRHLGQFREGGQTAPTLGRLGLVKLEMLKTFAPNWGRYVARDEFEGFEMCDGTRIRFRYAHQQSAAKGAPIQGYNWSWCGRDEMQDQVSAHEDIESRGRSALNAHYDQLGTATAKDDSEWRELRDVILTKPEDGSDAPWVKRSLSIFRSPFVDPKFLASKAKSMSKREFLRRYGDPITGEVSDLPPELAVYYGWLRSRNLVALPQIAKDVTSAVLSGYPSYLYRGQGFGLLVAHDPGVIFNTSVVMKMLMFGTVPTWVVVGEKQTKQTTTHQHAQELVKYLRDEFYVRHPTIGGPNALVFPDPHGKGEGQTDYSTVYSAFQKEGLDVFSPAAMTGRIKRTARVEMMNRLLGGTAEDSSPPRLVIATDQQGRPVAPRLVEAFESLKKKPGDDDPEGSQRKDIDDKTHAPAATAYGLWMFEQEALTESTVKVAKKAAGIRV